MLLFLVVAAGAGAGIIIGRLLAPRSQPPTPTVAVEEWVLPHGRDLEAALAPYEPIAA